MNQQEIIDQIKSLLNSSEKAIIEIQNGTNIDFYITLIQQNNIDCFNLSKRIQSTKVSESNIASKLEIQKPHEPITVQVGWNRSSLRSKNTTARNNENRS